MEKAKDFEKKRNLCELGLKYTQVSSAHGFSFVGNTELPWYDRLFWFFIVIAFTIISVYITVTGFNEWRENQVLTTLTSSAAPISGETFPTVTICSQGLDLEAVGNALLRDFEEWRLENEKDKNSSITDEAAATDLAMKEYISAKFMISNETTIDLFDLVYAMSSSNIEKTMSVSQLHLNLDQIILVNGSIKSSVDTSQSVPIQNTENIQLTATEVANEAITTPSETSENYQSTATEVTNEAITTPSETSENYQSTATEVTNEAITTPSETSENYQSTATAVTNEVITTPTETSQNYQSTATAVTNKAITTSAQTAIDNEKEKNTDNNGVNGSRTRRKRAVTESDNIPSDLETIDLFLNPDKSQTRTSEAKLKSDDTQSFITKNIKKIYEEIFKLLWYSKLPCSPTYVSSNSLIQNCQFGGKAMDCRKIFKPSPTDIGICCAFNSQETLRESNYTRMLNQLNYKDMEGFKDIQKDPLSIITGKGNGLSFMLDQHSDIISFGTVEGDANGFLMYVGESDEFPTLQVKSLMLNAGSNHDIEIVPYFVTTSSDLDSMDPETRTCFKRDEKDLYFYSKYSQSSCRFECSLLLAEQEEGCIPWYLPQRNNGTPCDPWKSSKFRQTMKKQKVGSCNCLPDCTATFYSSIKSTSAIRPCDSKNLNQSPMCDLEDPVLPNIYGNEINKTYQELVEGAPAYLKNKLGSARYYYKTTTLRNMEIFSELKQDMSSYDAFSKDVSTVTVYFAQPTALQYERIEFKTALSFLSDIGGNFGLFLGFSFLSFLELIYWFIYRFTCNP
ncbi:uncharacterized protein LOC111696020 [Eurytemora carolleeae]|uniref:uncharacterized protein LOC111696020 n=1 Tax=Eurytemora carolleeae TaxID=1294199 RepID=UPI000C765C87|nr:uncharacterized protein LOC111696020 [Eurytemora carolleeae]|eukprot:XP_023321306.1 uncharacterized protein LOC111696020 [Eurytemora affinis]